MERGSVNSSRMKREALKRIPLRANPFLGLGQKVHHFLFALFLFQFVLIWLGLWTGFPNFGNARWPEGLLLVLCAATTVASLARRLPSQNVMLASFIIMVIAGIAHVLGATIAIPFGPYIYGDRIGQLLFYPLPWAIPLIWLVAIFSSRGVARLVMRPWRKTRSYGFWVMGLTVFLVVLFDLGLEPFATQIRHYWTWNPTNAGLFWYTTPWVNFLGWAATAVMILAFATPSLISKKPVKQPTDFAPLIIWLLVNALFLTGAMANHLWTASIVEAVGMAAAAIFAIRGGTW